ncbi:anthranilate synthase component I family protein [Dinghuibacter silviterrae]|uniref:Anthranilate synthase component 1 n=1 Tax=Dinghuibacter silviterrae TaxID=1539049 RepID=A0A4V3GLU5_9BACT|nr:anthranilate synthase component I family protein [Dinghuibacter silviterrae]TDX00943.1 anthranilate synthase component 1 [Dinghuibacter silviterrae]
MSKITITTTYKKMLSDVFTPVGIYLRLRDRFRDTVLLESTDFHAGQNSYSLIGINAMAGIEISSLERIETKVPKEEAETQTLQKGDSVPDLLWHFMQRFEVNAVQDRAAALAQGLFGYTTFDAEQFFEPVVFKRSEGIPLMRYRLYQYVIVINHYKEELYLCENVVKGMESEAAAVESLIRSKDVPVYPFRTNGAETSNMEDETYRDMVRKGIKSCYRGDVFQVVLSRRFERSFIGDEFNVYRALRSINPSPYLFFFDYGDYRLMGSSPESQLIVRNHKAIIHPIAGTFRRTGDDVIDKEAAERLLQDPKENAEHVMLVDLARNDLSRSCTEVEVSEYRQVQYYSHVIHLVSEVTGKVPAEANPFRLLATTFPAGTLSGAPKFKAMQLIDAYEPTPRGYYGGAIGFVGFDGGMNHAIMIRTFLSKDNHLYYQAGAGIVAASDPESELQEVNNKLNALKKALELAEQL